MKMTRALALLALAGMVGAVQAQNTSSDPTVGQTLSQVIDTLGKPYGQIGDAAKTYLCYPRGKIVMKNGVVAAVDLVSVAEQRVRDAQRAEAEARQQAERDKANALLAEYLQDPDYLALSTTQRMKALERYQIFHPAAQVDTEYQALRAIYLDDLATRRAASRSQNNLTLSRNLPAARVRIADTQTSLAAPPATTAAQKTPLTASYGQNIGYYTPLVTYPYSPPVTIVTVSNGQAAVVMTNSQPFYCAPTLTSFPRSGFSLAISGPNYQFRLGSVAFARPTLALSPLL